MPQENRKSEQYPEDWDDAALPRRRRDFVEIDVGGRNFAAAISTLRANSSYFDALFSREWYREEGTVFVDQDPDAFAVLQSFMRLGSIDSTPRSPRRFFCRQNFLAWTNSSPQSSALPTAI
jgi:hypothetical protein